MKNEKTMLFTLMALVLLLASCKNSGKRAWQITNNSTSEVFIEADSTFAPIMTNSIPPGQVITVLVAEDTGILSAVDRLNWLIYTEFDTLSKDPNKDANWMVTVDEEGSISYGYSRIFEFEFRDSDF